MAVWGDWEPGFSDRDLRFAEERYGFHFPPDLRDFLRHRRFPDGYDWSGGLDAVERALEAPLDGILFDVENSRIWWPEWGPRPTAAPDRARIVADQVAKAPRLIPLLGHRYMPDDPVDVGNPVFSVMQMDIIYYGCNLIEYISNEFARPHDYKLSGDVKFIPFWSTAVDRAYGPEARWSDA